MADQDGLNIVRWLFCALATLATTGRFYLHHRYNHAPLRPDSLLNLLALLCLIALNATFLVTASTSSITLQLQTTLASYFLLWSTLYLVKASFLALCWSVFRPSPSFRRWWWAVALYTFLTFWPITLSQLWQCGDPAKWDDPVTCESLLSSNMKANAESKAAFILALHASSDLFILALPLAFIHQLHMSRGKKVSVASVFAVIAVDILMGVLRNGAVVWAGLGVGVEVNEELAIWMENLEAGVAVLVCAAPAYGVLLPAARRRMREGVVELREDVGGIGKRKGGSRRSGETDAGDGGVGEAVGGPVGGG